MPGFLNSGKGMPLLLIPEYSGINKGQRIPDTCPWNSPGHNTGVVSHSLLQVIFLYIHTNKWSSGGISGKEHTCQCRRHKRLGLDPWIRKIPWKRAWPPRLVFLLGEFHGQRSLVGHSPWCLRVRHN